MPYVEKDLPGGGKIRKSISEDEGFDPSTVVKYASYDRGEFLEALTDAVVIKIIELSKTEIAYELLWEKFRSRNLFVGNHPLLLGGLQALVDDPRVPFSAEDKKRVCEG